jgi:flavin-dependent dehydrogenase
VKDVLVLGGGLAGGAAATWLARAGKSVHLVERHAYPADKMCGEFLSIEAQRHLAELGIDLDRLGAVHVDRMRLISGHTVIEAKLPFVARGVSRRRLDEALLAMAEHAGAQVERGVRVTELRGDHAVTGAGDRHGRTIMLATGKLPVRENGSANQGVPRDSHVGFKMHWRLDDSRARERLARVVQMTLFPGGYAGLQLIERDIANLCLVVRRDWLSALGGRWEDVLGMLRDLPLALQPLSDATPLFAKPLTVANLAYGRAHRADPNETIYRLGDQAAMTASLTGDGMAIALRSARIAVTCAVAGHPASDYHRQLHAAVGAQIRRGMLVQRLSEVPWTRSACVQLLRWHPALLRSVTRWTRLPDMAPE